MKHAADLIARCFAARTSAHFAHLKTKSYAAHMALEGFYTDVVDAADAFAECYQGVFGLITDYPDYRPTQGELTPIKDLRDWLSEHRAATAQGHRELENLIDEITAVCDRAIYRLVHLK